MFQLSQRRLVQMATVAVVLCGLGRPLLAEPGNDNRAPDVGSYTQLQVPEGNKVAFHAYAVGVQVWGWDGGKWVLLRPEAFLYANADDTGPIGTHYFGPTWESTSGSYVVGAVIERAYPDPTAVPWLKLGAVRSGGPGIFDGITFIQRVNTVGGIAPSYPGDNVGDTVRVPYAAEYYFYRKSE